MSFFGWQSLVFERLDCEGVSRTTRRWHWLQILRLILLHEIRSFCIIANNTSFSSTAHTPPPYELGQMDISCTTYYLRSHYNNLCMAQLGSAQRSVATSHQTDYPGRLLLQSAVSFCRPIKDMPIRTKSPLNFPSISTRDLNWTFEHTLLGLVCIIRFFSRRKIMSLTTFHSLCMAHNRGSLLAALFLLWPRLWIHRRILDLRFYRYHRVCALRTPPPSFN